MSKGILPGATGPRLSLSSAILDDDRDGNNDRGVGINVSQVFTNHLKTEGWSKRRLHKLHAAILVLTFFIYACHIISTPPFQVVSDKMNVVIVGMVQLLLLVIGIICWLTMCYVNGSSDVARMIFKKKCANIHLPVLANTVFSGRVTKGRALYAFTHVIHSIMIYSTDTWYICDQKLLIINLGMFLSVMAYEFFVSLSPHAIRKPSWKFINVQITANSLARSNFFNLSLIF